MLQNSCIIARHAEYLSHEKGLTAKGFLKVKETAEKIIKEIQTEKIKFIDLALVSNAPRCQLTFAALQNFLLENNIFIKEILIKQKFHCLSSRHASLEENIFYSSASTVRTVLREKKKITLVVTHNRTAEDIYFNLTNFHLVPPLNEGEYIFFKYIM